MWRVFVNDEDGKRRLFNLANPRSFGMVDRNEGTDPEFMAEYEHVFEWFDSRLASDGDFECRPDDDEILVYFTELEEAAEVADGVLAFRDDGENARYYEEGGYYTLVSRKKTSDSSIDESLRRLTAEIREQFTGLRTDTFQHMGIRISEIQESMRQQPRLDSVQYSPGEDNVKLAEHERNVRKVMSELGIFESKGSLTSNQAVNVMRHFRIRISPHTLTNRWIKEGQIRHSKEAGKYRIDVLAIAEVIADGPRTIGTYESFYTPDPKKRPHALDKR
jgi:hypothetical protein